MANAPADISPEPVSKKRKLSENSEPELEIDVNLPEPPSKKDLRKLKKLKSKGVDTDALTSLNVPLIDRSKKGAQEGEAPADGANSKRSPYGVWIGNLSFNTTREELIEFFTRGSEDGDGAGDKGDTETTRTGIRQKDITRLHLPKSTKFKNQNKGFAYVDFVTAVCISNALKLSERLFHGRKVLIKASTDFNGRPEDDKNKKKGDQSTIDAGKNPPCRSIFVGNLGYEVTEQEIFRHFSPAGKIKKVRFMTFEDSGKCKGFSWVDFEELKSAENVFAGRIEGTHDSEDEDEGEDDKKKEEDHESGSEAEGQERQIKRRKTTRKQKKRKINPYAFMDGRKLRLEYGEDSTTRYKKRFGDGKTDTNGKPDSPHKKPARDKPARKDAVKEQKRELTTEEKQAKTVEFRLTGRIVEGTGKKVTFD